MIYAVFVPVGIVSLCILTMAMLLVTKSYLARHHGRFPENRYPPQYKPLAAPAKERKCALDAVSLVKYPCPGKQEEAVEYIRNNGSASVKVTVKQERCSAARWQTNLLVFNRVLPGQEIRLGFAGHEETSSDVISAAHTILTAEYL